MLMRSEKRQRDQLISFRVSDAELDLLRDAARRRDIPVSQLLRDAALREAETVVPPPPPVPVEPVVVHRPLPSQCPFCAVPYYSRHRSSCAKYEEFKMPQQWCAELGLPDVGPIWRNYPITKAEFLARQRDYGGN